jgi:hypothetical protein
MQYPRVMTLKDGKNETLFTVQDFEYLVDKYMGMDAVRYFRSLMEEYSERESNRERHVSGMCEAVRSLNQKIAELESDFHDL